MKLGFIVVMACLMGMAHSDSAGSGIIAHFRCEGNDLYTNGMSFEDMCPDFRFMIEPTETVSDDVVVSVYAVKDPFGLDTCLESGFESKPGSGLVFTHTISASDINSATEPIDVAELASGTTLSIDDSECVAICIAPYVEVGADLTLIQPMQNAITDCNKISEEQDVSVSVAWTSDASVSLEYNEDGHAGFYLSQLISSVTVSYSGPDSSYTLKPGSEMLPHSVVVFMRPASINQRMIDSFPSEETCGMDSMGNVTLYDDPLHFFNTNETLYSGVDWVLNVDDDIFVALGSNDAYLAQIPRCPICEMASIYVAWDIYGQYWLNDPDACNNYDTKEIFIDCSDVDFMYDTVVVSPNPLMAQMEVHGKKCNGDNPQTFQYYPALGNAFTSYEPSWESAEDIMGYQRARFISALWVDDYFQGAFFNSTETGGCMASETDHSHDGTYNGEYWPSFEYMAANERWDLVDWSVLDSMDEPDYLQPPFRPVTENMTTACLRKLRREEIHAGASDAYLLEGCRNLMEFVFQDKRCPVDEFFYNSEGGIDMRMVLSYFTMTRPEQAFINKQICEADYNNTNIDRMSCGNRVGATFFFRHNVNFRRRVARDAQPLNETDYWGNENLKRHSMDFFSDFMNIDDELDYMMYCPRGNMWDRLVDDVPLYVLGQENMIVVGTPDTSVSEWVNRWAAPGVISCMDGDECYSKK